MQMHTYTLFTSDGWPYAFIVILASTTGYFSTLCFMYGPSLVDPAHVELAATTMVCDCLSLYCRLTFR